MASQDAVGTKVQEEGAQDVKDDKEKESVVINRMLNRPAMNKQEHKLWDELARVAIQQKEGTKQQREYLETEIDMWTVMLYPPRPRPPPSPPYSRNNDDKSCVVN